MYIEYIAYNKIDSYICMKKLFFLLLSLSYYISIYLFQHINLPYSAVFYPLSFYVTISDK